MDSILSSARTATSNDFRVSSSLNPRYPSHEHDQRSVSGNSQPGLALQRGGSLYQTLDPHYGGISRPTRIASSDPASLMSSRTSSFQHQHGSRNASVHVFPAGDGDMVRNQPTSNPAQPQPAEWTSPAIVPSAPTTANVSTDSIVASAIQRSMQESAAHRHIQRQASVPVSPPTGSSSLTKLAAHHGDHGEDLQHRIVMNNILRQDYKVIVDEREDIESRKQKNQVGERQHIPQERVGGARLHDSTMSSTAFVSAIAPSSSNDATRNVSSTLPSPHGSHSRELSLGSSVNASQLRAASPKEQRERLLEESRSWWSQQSAAAGGDGSPSRSPFRSSYHPAATHTVTTTTTRTTPSYTSSVRSSLRRLSPPSSTANDMMLSRRQPTATSNRYRPSPSPTRSTGTTFTERIQRRMSPSLTPTSTYFNSPMSVRVSTSPSRQSPPQDYSRRTGRVPPPPPLPTATINNASKRNVAARAMSPVFSSTSFLKPPMFEDVEEAEEAKKVATATGRNSASSSSRPTSIQSPSANEAPRSPADEEAEGNHHPHRNFSPASSTAHFESIPATFVPKSDTTNPNNHSHYLDADVSPIPKTKEDATMHSTTSSMVIGESESDVGATAEQQLIVEANVAKALLSPNDNTELVDSAAVSPNRSRKLEGNLSPPRSERNSSPTKPDAQWALVSPQQPAATVPSASNSGLLPVATFHEHFDEEHFGVADGLHVVHSRIGGLKYSLAVRSLEQQEHADRHDITQQRTSFVDRLEMSNTCFVEKFYAMARATREAQKQHKTFSESLVDFERCYKARKAIEDAEDAKRALILKTDAQFYEVMLGNQAHINKFIFGTLEIVTMEVSIRTNAIGAFVEELTAVKGYFVEELEAMVRHEVLTKPFAIAAEFLAAQQEQQYPEHDEHDPDQSWARQALIVATHRLPDDVMDAIAELAEGHEENDEILAERRQRQGENQQRKKQRRAIGANATADDWSSYFGGANHSRSASALSSVLVPHRRGEEDHRSVSVLTASTIAAHSQTIDNIEFAAPTTNCIQSALNRDEEDDENFDVKPLFIADEIVPVRLETSMAACRQAVTQHSHLTDRTNGRLRYHSDDANDLDTDRKFFDDGHHHHPDEHVEGSFPTHVNIGAPSPAAYCQHILPLLAVDFDEGKARIGLYEHEAKVFTVKLFCAHHRTAMEKFWEPFERSFVNTMEALQRHWLDTRRSLHKKQLQEFKHLAEVSVEDWRDVLAAVERCIEEHLTRKAATPTRRTAGTVPTGVDPLGVHGSYENGSKRLPTASKTPGYGGDVDLSHATTHELSTSSPTRQRMTEHHYALDTASSAKKLQPDVSRAELSPQRLRDNVDVDSSSMLRSAANHSTAAPSINTIMESTHTNAANRRIEASMAAVSQSRSLRKQAGGDLSREDVDLLFSAADVNRTGFVSEANVIAALQLRGILPRSKQYLSVASKAFKCVLAIQQRDAAKNGASADDSSLVGSSMSRNDLHASKSKLPSLRYSAEQKRLNALKRAAEKRSNRASKVSSGLDREWFEEFLIEVGVPLLSHHRPQVDAESSPQRVVLDSSTMDDLSPIAPPHGDVQTAAPQSAANLTTKDASVISISTPMFDNAMSAREERGLEAEHHVDPASSPKHQHRANSTIHEVLTHKAMQAISAPSSPQRPSSPTRRATLEDPLAGPRSPPRQLHQQQLQQPEVKVSRARLFVDSSNSAAALTYKSTRGTTATGSTRTNDSYTAAVASPWQARQRVRQAGLDNTTLLAGEMIGDEAEDKRLQADVSTVKGDSTAAWATTTTSHLKHSTHDSNGSALPVHADSTVGDAEIDVGGILADKDEMQVHHTSLGTTIGGPGTATGVQEAAKRKRLQAIGDRLLSGGPRPSAVRGPEQRLRSGTATASTAHKHTKTNEDHSDAVTPSPAQHPITNTNKPVEPSSTVHEDPVPTPRHVGFNTNDETPSVGPYHHLHRRAMSPPTNHHNGDERMGQIVCDTQGEVKKEPQQPDTLKLDDRQERQVRGLFARANANGEGCLSVSNLAATLQSIGISLDGSDLCGSASGESEETMLWNALETILAKSGTADDVDNMTKTVADQNKIFARHDGAEHWVTFPMFRSLIASILFASPDDDEGDAAGANSGDTVAL